MGSKASPVPNYNVWRRNVTDAGLLVPAASAYKYCANKISKAPGECGVSLAWLESFAQTMVDSGAQDMSTAEVVARLISPACTVKNSCSIQIDVQRSNSAGMPNANQDGHFPSIPQAGNQSGKLARPESRPATSAAAPGHREMHVRLIDMIPVQWTGAPNLYIIHAWQASCLDCLRAVISYIKTQQSPRHSLLEAMNNEVTHHEGADGSTPAPPSPVRPTAAMYVWLDWVAVVQQQWTVPPGGVNSCRDIHPTLMWGPPPASLDVFSARENIGRCANGALMVLDKDMQILTRTWPLYEAWAADYYAPVADGVEGAHLQLTLVADARPAALLSMRKTCLNLDLTRSECTRPEDKQRIIGEVKSSSGLKRMQEALGTALLAGVRTALRWSGRLTDVALFSALLLQCGDYSQLQHLLHSMPGLADDEATLKDIRAIFAMYDADGTGELELEEFTAVLALAGFGEEEARRIFGEVDKDNGGSVGLEEFESWWIESQRTQTSGMRPAVQLTLGALVSNLTALSGLLERKDLPAPAALIMQHVRSLQSQGIGGQKGSETLLPPYSMSGDYLSVADQIVFKIMAGQLRPALRMMLSLLRTNADALSLEGPPETLLPHMSSLHTLPPQVQRAALAWSMSLVAELLGRNPGRMREAQHFAREALELAAQGADEEGGMAGGLTSHFLMRRPGAKPRVVEVKARDQKNRDAIVSSMVRLKYGKDSLISHRLIAEASISLSTWMASSKSSSTHKFLKGNETGGGTKGRSGTSAADAANGVNQFASAYLGGNPSAAPGHDGSQGNVSKETSLPMPMHDLCRVLHTAYKAAKEKYMSSAHRDAQSSVVAAKNTDASLDRANSPRHTPSTEQQTAGTTQQSGQVEAGAAKSGSLPRGLRNNAPPAIVLPPDNDDANIEQLALIARADPTGFDSQDSPFAQLGSRLDKVRSRQQQRNWHPPSPTRMARSCESLSHLPALHAHNSPSPTANPPLSSKSFRGRPLRSPSRGRASELFGEGLPTAASPEHQRTSVHRTQSRKHRKAASCSHSPSMVRPQCTSPSLNSGLMLQVKAGFGSIDDPLAQRLAMLGIPNQDEANQ